MFRSITNNTAKNLSAGGTISGDVTISGDLTVNGSATNSYDEIVNGDLHVKSDSGNSTSAFLVEQNDGTDVFVVDTTNTRVGIGTSGTPAQLLHLAHATDASIQLERVDTSVADGDGIGAILFRGGESSQTDVARIRVNADADWTSSSSPTKMIFETTPSGATADAVALTIDSSQNATFAGQLTSDHHIISTSADEKGISIQNTANASALRSLEMYIDSSGKGCIRKTSAGGADNDLFLQPAYGNVCLTGAGNFGIGDATPDDKLSIYGGDKQIRMGADDSNHVVIGRNSSSGHFEMARTCTNAAEEVFFRAAENEAGALTFFTSEVARFIIDANSRISLSNNDSGGTGGGDSTSGNTLFGFAAGNSIASGGIRNSIVGHGSGYNLDTGTDNILIGKVSGFTMESEIGNVVIGNEAGEHIRHDTSDYNVFIGHQASTGGTGSRNQSVAIGYRAWGSGGSANNIGGAENVFIGAESGGGTWATAASDGNTAVGWNTMKGAMNGAGLNTAVGKNALLALTEGDRNVTIGADAGKAITTANRNTAVGYQALYSEDADGDRTVAIGHQALYSQNGNDEVMGNTAVGYISGFYNVTGRYNTYMGYGSGGAGAGGTASHSSNTGIGYKALEGITTGGSNVAIGRDAMISATTAAENVAIGYEALGDVDTGSGANVAIGYYAMRNVDEGTGGGDADYNIAIGYDALKGGDFASNDRALQGNIAIGMQAMNSTADNAQTGTIAVGHQSLKALTSGTSNTAIGYFSMGTNTNSSNNTAFGYYTLGNMDGGNGSNTAVGNLAMLSNTTGATNTAVGDNASRLNQTGVDNVAVGRSALYSNTTSYNTAIGLEAMYSTTSGSSNTAVGYQSLHGDTDGDGADNTAIGHKALHDAVSPSKNVAIGDSAMRVMNGTANGIADCVAIGANAFYGDATNTTTGANGTVAIGKDSLKALTSGSKNIAIGFDAMGDMQTGTNNIALGYESMNALQGGDGSGGIAASANAGNHNIAIGTDAMGAVEGYRSTTEIDGNIAIGTNALLGGDLLNNNIDFIGNIAIGYNALDATGNAQGMTGTIGIGYQALTALTSGSQNTAVGYNNMLETTQGSYNTTLGYNVMSQDAGLANTNNTFIGANAGSGDWTTTACTSNTGVGAGVMQSAMNGATNNTAVGLDGLNALTSGDNNTAIGRSSLDALTTGVQNTAVGSFSLSTAVGVSNCTAIGYAAMNSANTQDGSTAVGFAAANYLTGALGVTVTGFAAGRYVTTGDYSTAFGYNALGGNSGGTAITGNDNTALGANAGRDIEGAAEGNVLVGKDAGIALTTGNFNVLIGRDAGDALLDETHNTAIGTDALGGSSLVDQTVIVGSQAGLGAMTAAADGTVAVGYAALTALTSGAGNTAVGFQALDGITTSAQNTAVGYSALTAVGDSYANTAVGYQAGDTITNSGAFNVCIGTDADVSTGAAENQIVIGRATTGVGNNSVTLGNSAVTDVYMSQDSGAYVHSQNVPNQAANAMSSPYYRFDGTNDTVDCGDVMPSGFGDSFSIDLWVYPEDVSARREFIGQYQNSNYWWRFGIDGSANWEIDVQDNGSRTVELNPDSSLVAYKWQHVVLTRDGATWNFYLNGNLDATGSDSSTIPDIAANVKLGEPVDSPFQGQMAGVKIWNETLSATEVKELYSGASVPFKYKGASQTDLIESNDAGSGTAWTGATGTTPPDGWTSGGTNRDFAIDSSSGSGAEPGLKITAGIGNAWIRQNWNTVKGKRYRAKFIYKNTAGDVLQYGTDGGSTLTDLASSTSWSGVQTIEWTGTGSTDLIFVAKSTGDIVWIDSVSITRIGAVAEYDGSGIASDKWFDKSGNDFHGTVSGSSIENAPAGDDGLVYEEGDWTPVLSDGSNNATSAANTEGTYTRIGRQVTVCGRIQTSSLGSVSGGIQINGLPFTAGNDDKYKSVGNIGLGLNLNVTAGYNIDGYVAANSSSLFLYINDVATGGSAMTGAEWSADGHAIIQVTYFV